MDKLRRTNLLNSIKEAISGSEQSARQIEMYYTYMNYHLELLHKAMGENNAEHISFHKERLREISNILSELEYFSTL